MEHLRRIIIPESEDGFGFTFTSKEGNILAIEKVSKLSYAERAGLKAGDRIISINGNLVRNLNVENINNILKTFRKSTLVLTVLPNLVVNDKVEVKAQLQISKPSETRKFKGPGARFGSSLKEERLEPDGKPRRKFNKYSRNMSDVTDSSRLYCMNLLYQQQHRLQQQQPSQSSQQQPTPLAAGDRRGSSSPLHQSVSPRVSPVLSTDSSKKKLQLNRVGGLVRTTPPTSGSGSALSLATKTVDPPPPVPTPASVVGETNKRLNKLTYLTCSPIPYYRQSTTRRLQGSEESQDRSSLADSDLAALSRKVSNDADEETAKQFEGLQHPFSSTNPSEDKVTKPINTESSIAASCASSTTAAGSVRTSSPLQKKDTTSVLDEEPLLHNIDAANCRIMWKMMRNQDVDNPTWRKSEIAVESGIFKVVREFEDDEEDEDEFDDEEGEQDGEENQEEGWERERLSEEEEGESNADGCSNGGGGASDDVCRSHPRQHKPPAHRHHQQQPISRSKTRSKTPRAPISAPIASSLTFDGSSNSHDDAAKPVPGTFVYSFNYTDVAGCKWDFLIEFENELAATKWISFFELEKSKEPEKGVKFSANAAQTRSGVTQALEAVQVGKNEAAPNKSRLHHALSRVRNFTTRRLTHGDPGSEFKRQQEEWLAKTEPHFQRVAEAAEGGRLPASVALVTVPDNSATGSEKETGVQTPHFATLPLDKWQRSLESQLIPFVVEICIRVIEKFGLQHVGIYRVSGNKLSLDALNAELRKPIHEIDLSSDVWNDIYALSGILKSFLRNLPDGVFPKDFYFELISAWRQHERDREKRLLSVQRLLTILDSVPGRAEYRHHRETLRYLARHLHLVASHAVHNRMTVKNLAVVFAPTLIRPPQETNELLMSDYRFRIELVETIIHFHEWMFSPSFESACNIPAEVEPEPLAATLGGTGGIGAVGGSTEGQLQTADSDEDISHVAGAVDDHQQTMTSGAAAHNDGGDARGLIRDMLTELTRLVAQHKLESCCHDNPDSVCSGTKRGDEVSSRPGGVMENNQYTLIELVPHKELAAVARPQLHEPAPESAVAIQQSCNILENAISCSPPTPRERLQQCIKRPSFKRKKLGSSCVSSSSVCSSSSSTSSIRREPPSISSGGGGASSSSGGTVIKETVPHHHFPTEQLMLTNKKLYALSLALITTSSHPLNSPIIAEDCGAPRNTPTGQPSHTSLSS